MTRERGEPTERPMDFAMIGYCPEPTPELLGVATMGYAQHHEYMEAKLRRGAKSDHCGACDRWRFRGEQCPHFVGDAVPS